MEFDFTGRHDIEVTPAIRAHVAEHFQKLGHIFENSSTARVHIIIDVNKNRHIAEVILGWREHTLTATDTNADMYQALTRVIDKIEKQAVKLRKKLIERKKGATPRAALASPAPFEAESAGGDAAAAPPATPRIINVRNYRVKPMTAEEAVMSLAEDSNQFVLFRDADTGGLSVLYRRRDGNYGLIQP